MNWDAAGVLVALVASLLALASIVSQARAQDRLARIALLDKRLHAILPALEILDLAGAAATLATAVLEGRFGKVTKLEEFGDGLYAKAGQLRTINTSLRFLFGPDAAERLSAVASQAEELAQAFARIYSGRYSEAGRTEAARKTVALGEQMSQSLSALEESLLPYVGQDRFFGLPYWMREEGEAEMRAFLREPLYHPREPIVPVLPDTDDEPKMSDPD